MIERRKAVGGNILDRDEDGINVRLYGAHIFHTDNERVWRFVNRFDSFNNYVHTVMARNGGRLFHLPVNLQTFYEIFGIARPQDIRQPVFLRPPSGHTHAWLPADNQRSARRSGGGHG